MELIEANLTCLASGKQDFRDTEKLSVFSMQTTLCIDRAYRLDNFNAMPLKTFTFKCHSLY